MSVVAVAGVGYVAKLAFTLELKLDDTCGA
jgi:hypothetical protein